MEFDPETDYTPLNPDDIYKFVDDNNFLEIIILVQAGLTCYNLRNHVASDISVENKFLPVENFSTNKHLEKIDEWTTKNEMCINFQKTKYMIVNFCSSYQFNTRVTVNNSILDQVHETRLLGVIFSEDLSWHSNTNSLIKRAYARMTMLRKLYDFHVPKQKLILIYKLFIRSVTEQSSVVWSSSITEEESCALERTQKVALRLIYRGEYKSYFHALEISQLPTLEKRREKLLNNFAIKITKNNKTAHMLPKNKPNPSLRKQEKYHVDLARTSRLKNSPINAMAHLLNKTDSYDNTSKK